MAGRGGGSGPSFLPPCLALQSHRPTPPHQPSVSQFKEGFHVAHLCASSCFIRIVWHRLVSQKAVSSWRAGAVSFMSSLAPSPALNSLVAVVGHDECNCSATFLWHYGDNHSGSRGSLPILPQIWFEENVYHPQLQAQERALMVRVRLRDPAHLATDTSSGMGISPDRGKSGHRVVLAQALVNCVMRHSAA